MTGSRDVAHRPGYAYDEAGEQAIRRYLQQVRRLRRTPSGP